MPCHTPVAIVPKVVIDVCPGYVDLICNSSDTTAIVVSSTATFIVLPDLVKAAPADIWPAPENCSTVMLVVPNVGVPLCVNT